MKKVVMDKDLSSLSDVEAKVLMRLEYLHFNSPHHVDDDFHVLFSREFLVKSLAPEANSPDRILRSLRAKGFIFYPRPIKHTYKITLTYVEDVSNVV